MDTSQLYSSTSTGSTMGDQNQAHTRGGRRRSREIETLSLEITNYPRDLLQTFIPTDRNTPPRVRPLSEMEAEREEEEEDDKDVEFNLGLSLGGRFGVDKSHRGLIRSSSIAGAIPCLGEEAGEAGLARTSSLPTFTEEEWRRRKATLRRMEAKRRRSEKQRSAKETGEERESLEGQSCKRRRNPGTGGFFRSLQGLLAHSQGQGGTSSATASDLENKAIQGSSGRGGEAGTPTSSLQGAAVGPSSSKRSEMSEHEKKKKKTEELGSSGMEDMPSVFTIGDGPNGRKVEGILYRYARGEEVRIMCVCHGTFLSPADFVKHAGGTNVDHPHRHIVVNPSSYSFP